MKRQRLCSHVCEGDAASKTTALTQDAPVVVRPQFGPLQHRASPPQAEETATTTSEEAAKQATKAEYRQPLRITATSSSTTLVDFCPGALAITNAFQNGVDLVKLYKLSAEAFVHARPTLSRHPGLRAATALAACCVVVALQGSNNVREQSEHQRKLADALARILAIAQAHGMEPPLKRYGFRNGVAKGGWAGKPRMKWLILGCIAALRIWTGSATAWRKPAIKDDRADRAWTTSRRDEAVVRSTLEHALMNAMERHSAMHTEGLNPGKRALFSAADLCTQIPAMLASAQSLEAAGIVGGIPAFILRVTGKDALRLLTEDRRPWLLNPQYHGRLSGVTVVLTAGFMGLGIARVLAHACIGELSEDGRAYVWEDSEVLAKELGTEVCEAARSWVDAGHFVGLRAEVVALAGVAIFRKPMQLPLRSRQKCFPTTALPDDILEDLNHRAALAIPIRDILHASKRTETGMAAGPAAAAADAKAAAINAIPLGGRQHAKRFTDACGAGVLRPPLPVPFNVAETALLRLRELVADTDMPDCMCEASFQAAEVWVRQQRLVELRSQQTPISCDRRGRKNSPLQASGAPQTRMVASVAEVVGARPHSVKVPLEASADFHKILNRLQHEHEADIAGLCLEVSALQHSRYSSCIDTDFVASKPVMETMHSASISGVDEAGSQKQQQQQKRHLKQEQDQEQLPLRAHKPPKVYRSNRMKSATPKPVDDQIPEIITNLNQPGRRAGLLAEQVTLRPHRLEKGSVQEVSRQHQQQQQQQAKSRTIAPRNDGLWTIASGSLGALGQKSKPGCIGLPPLPSLRDVAKTHRRFKGDDSNVSMAEMKNANQL
eukprot:CAMPEP_0172671162 /NCGR_PEP_ID=MMETSP1074-20121228/10747_1 /TAXON_ID=2916 /ORGANISM="Ceratium fusus, Strain PA161109" /LENGTH=834 /DNA_ID=CAMNT_0013488167 /DNA_START=94 /DNA_END=2595 /DNA_ORIENTATION=-